jgi:selenocysteine lyase/cysteine desulfurase
MVNDVQDFGCDFLVCSPYKFFGPHQGTLWGRREVLEALEPYKVRPAPDAIPWCFSPGTASHEGMAGTAAAVDYFAWVGETMAGGEGDRRQKVRAGMAAIAEYEQGLSQYLVQGLQSVPGITIHGITANEAMSRRGPTVASRGRSRRRISLRGAATTTPSKWRGLSVYTSRAAQCGWGPCTTTRLTRSTACSKH